MLGGETIQAMTWAWASSYKGNIKFLDGLNYKSSIEKKIGPLGVGDGSPLWEYKMKQLGKRRGIHNKIWETQNKSWTYWQSKFCLDCFDYGEFSSSKGITWCLPWQMGTLTNSYNTSSNTSMWGSRTRIW
jgi:hypothetical protein